jgi:hypothetical protein
MKIIPIRSTKIPLHIGVVLWMWSCGGWIYNNLCISVPITTVVAPRSRCTILCDKVFLLLAAGGGFVRMLRVIPRYSWYIVESGIKKSLKIPKGQSECVYRSRADNTMAKRKKVQKDKQRSTKHTYKTKDRVTRTPLKTGGEHQAKPKTIHIHILFLFWWSIHIVD